LVKGEEIEVELLAGKSIGIDAYNWLFQFLSIIRLPTGEPLRDRQGRVTSHLSGIFYRTANLIEWGIRPVYVFDGQPPGFKLITVVEREEVRREAERKWKEALAAGREEEARKYAQAASRLSDEMVMDAKQLVEAMGLPIVQAPSEGEAQVAMMVRKGDLWAGASQDWDSLPFGSTRLVRNLSITGRRKLPGKRVYIKIRPQLIELERVLRGLGITREQLIVLCMLMGTDYNPGVRGIGPKTALKLVKEHKSLDRVLEQVEWVGPDPRQIFDFFLNPITTHEYKLRWKAPDRNRLLEFMVEEHDFSEERVEKVLNTLEKAHEAQQASLSKWMRS
jgi:flap endonuclease-1